MSALIDPGATHFVLAPGYHLPRPWRSHYIFAVEIIDMNFRDGILGLARSGCKLAGVFFAAADWWVG
jgi:hypothetical protein